MQKRLSKKLLLCVFAIFGFLGALTTQLTNQETADTFLIFFVLGMAEAILTVIFDKKGKWTDLPFAILLFIFMILEAVICTLFFQLI